MILYLFAIEEEGNVKAVLGKCHCGRDGKRNALVCGAVKNSGLFAELVKVGLCIEFTHLRDLIARFDHARVDEVGDLAARLSGEVAESEYASGLQELNKFSLICFHFRSPYPKNSATQRR